MRISVLSYQMQREAVSQSGVNLLLDAQKAVETEEEPSEDEAVEDTDAERSSDTP